MKVHETSLPGVLRLEPFVVPDARGMFVKSFQWETFSALKLETVFAEEYLTMSRPGVLRGLHFQVPPRAQSKFVYCASGQVLDAVVDIRRSSPTFGQHALFELSAARPEWLYVPIGLAHGFCVREGPAVLLYKVTIPYAAEHDRGIRWDSAGIPWPVQNPILSERDRNFPCMAEFESPFI